MTVEEVLRAARAKTANPRHWCQLTRARDAQGRVGAADDAAVAFCMLGAISVTGADVKTKSMAMSVLGDIVGGSVGCWNDNPERQHSEVLDAFDKAIEKAGKL